MSGIASAPQAVLSRGQFNDAFVLAHGALVAYGRNFFRRWFGGDRAAVREAADEVVNQLYVEGREAADGGVQVRNWSAWLMWRMKRRCLDHARKLSDARAVTRSLAESGEAIGREEDPALDLVVREGAAADERVWKEIDRVIEGLGPDLQAVWELKRQNLTEAVIAEELGFTPAMVKHRVRRIYSELRWRFAELTAED